jgi:PmbA protein
MSNVMAGEFSANVDLGFLIENGEVGGRVKNTMISGNVFDMIGKIIGISSQQIPLGSSLFPYLLFDEVKVVG